MDNRADTMELVEIADTSPGVYNGPIVAPVGAEQSGGPLFAPAPSPAGKIAVPKRKAYPKTWAEVDNADQELMALLDNPPYRWKEIHQMWSTLTGRNDSQSTLRNRYKRLKV